MLMHVFEKNWIAPVGPHISKFEEILSKNHDVFNSVTASKSAELLLYIYL